jgi:predicted dehydrogenase
MGSVRMGVIGLGGISNVHIPGILNSPDAHLVAICDSNVGMLSTVGDRYGVPHTHRFTDFTELLKADIVDAVSICTPNFMHFPVAMEVAKYRKPFCIEKPVAMNAVETEHLLNVCKTNNIPNMVAFSYRFKPAARYARWLIQQGHLGRVNHIYGQYLQGWGNDDVPMSWRFSKALSGSGALGDLGSHMIDLSRFLVGDIKKVIASADTIIGQRRNSATNEDESVDVDDYCHYLAVLDAGVSGVFNISRFAYGRGNYQRVEVYGAEGALVYSLEQSDSLQVCIGPVFGQVSQFTEIQVPSHFYKDQMQSFFDIVNGHDDGLTATLEDGLVNQKTLDAIIESFEEEKWVTVR